MKRRQFVLLRFGAEAPTKFDLVIKRETAKALDLEVPPTVLPAPT